MILFHSFIHECVGRVSVLCSGVSSLLCLLDIIRLVHLGIRINLNENRTALTMKCSIEVLDEGCGERLDKFSLK